VAAPSTNGVDETFPFVMNCLWLFVGGGLLSALSILSLSVVLLCLIVGFPAIKYLLRDV